MSILSTRPVLKRPNEVARVDLDCTRYMLADDETITGTPAAAAASGISASAPAINNSTFKNEARGDVAIGKGLQFTITGGTAGTKYYVDVTWQTTGNPAQTISVRVPVHVKDA